MRIKMDCEVPEQQKHQLQLQQQQQQQSANKLYARKPQQQQQQPQQQPQQESSDDDDLTTTERKNLEFAQKLGYSEQSIHTALTRLGSEAKQNELLAELIKLTADAPRPPASSSSSNSHVSPSSSSNSSSSSGNTNGSLRHIVIDGSNVALSHGNNTVFSCRGIRICVDWFRQRGHRHITAFVPNWRKELANNNITEQELLYELEHERVLVFTPSRHLDGKRVSCYDDRFILKLAVETDGIVVSNDNYRDLLLESNEYRKVVQERLLMYSFVDDIFMPPEDPLGRSGPTLDVLLRAQQTQQKMSDAQQQLCPYGKKCTYGQKCKFRHQTAPLQLQRLPLQVSHSAPLHSNGGQQLLANSNSSNNAKLAALARTKSNTVEKISQQQQQQQQQLCHSFNNQLDLDAEPSQQLNRHKKLQRQAPPAFRLLVPPGNNNNNNNNSNNYHHQYLTRTPSAPLTDQHHQAAQLSPSMPAHNLAHLSASDSRINEELHTAQASREEQRRLLRYHLSSLFPQHQVHAVLQLYPDETNAKTICAAIINLFPHN